MMHAKPRTKTTTTSEICWDKSCNWVWGASSQAHDRLVLSTLRLSGPLWASLGLSGLQPASQPAPQAKRTTGSLS